MDNRSFSLAAFLLVMALLPAQQVFASLVYTFDNCASGNSSYCDGSGTDGYGGLILTVDDTFKELTFTHSGTDGRVHEIYLDFGKVLSDSDVTLIQDLGTSSVNYSFGAKPTFPPELSGSDFMVSLSVDAQGRRSDKLGGRDGDGEILKMVFNEALAFTDFMAAIHVGRLDGKYSDTFTTVSEVPLPAAFWLFGSALLGFWGLKRRHMAKVANT